METVGGVMGMRMRARCFAGQKYSGATGDLPSAGFAKIVAHVTEAQSATSLPPQDACECYYSNKFRPVCAGFQHALRNRGGLK